MADEMTSDDAFELKSVMQQILAQLKDTAAGTTEYSRRTAELIASEELDREATRASTTATEKNTKKMESLATKLDNWGNKFESLTSKLNQTQKDFGVSIAGAAKLQVSAIAASIKSFVDSFKSINFSQIFAGIKNLAGIAFDTFIEAGKAGFDLNGAGIKNAAMGGIDKFLAELTKSLSGKAPTQPLDKAGKEVLEATKFYQDEFGVINKEFGYQIALEAKNRGLSAQQLVQARRVFATTAMGDLNKVASIQSRFFDQFASKGLTPKVALEAIGKYAELIARNGNRFADSFARAAADAKKIGVDLGKVDQIGDNIIDNFEGFLESQAELGAMGFGFDSSRLMEIAETGDSGALFNELRSQLAATGKDITKLRRSERLALEGMGLNISDMLKMAGVTPGGETGETDPADETNNLLGQLLVLLAVTGPVFSFLGSAMSGVAKALSTGSSLVDNIARLAGFLGPGGWIAGMLLAIAAYLHITGNKEHEQIRKKMLSMLDHQNGTLTKEQLDELQHDYGTARAKKAGAVGTVIGGTAGFILGGPPGAVIGASIGGSAMAGAGYMGGAIEPQKEMFQKQEKIKEFNSYLNYMIVKKQREERGVPEASLLDQIRMGGIGSKKTHMQDGTYQVAPDQTNKNILDYLKKRGDVPGTPIKKATGGPVNGPGTGTSDSIPAMLSDGEYVLPAWLVSKIGVKNLDMLRNTVNSSDYGKLMMALLSGNLKDVTKISKNLAVEELMEYMLKKVLGISNIASIVTVAAGKNMYETYQANKDKPYPTWWSATEPGKIPSWVPRKRLGGLIGRVRGAKDSWREKYDKVQQGRELFGGFSRNNIVDNVNNVANSQLPGSNFAKWLSNQYQTRAAQMNTMTIPGMDFVNSGIQRKNSMMERGSNFAGWLSGKLQAGMERKDSMMKSGMNFLSGLPGAGRVSNLINTYREGGIGGVMSSGLNMVKNIPGVSALTGFAKNLPGAGTVMSAFSGFKEGGIGGAMKSLATTGIGKTIGGAVGSLIPIPGVGTMLGSFAGGTIAKGLGKLFGRKKKPSANAPSVEGMDEGAMAGMPGMARFNPEAMFAGMPGMQSASQPPVTVDTRGIEQKLNSFIAALNNIQINMDGAKVGKVLVNASDAANTMGVFRPNAQATL